MISVGGGSLIPISFIGMGMVDIGKAIPNPFDFAQGERCA